jgi:hypothetical protein
MLRPSPAIENHNPDIVLIDDAGSKSSPIADLDSRAGAFYVGKFSGRK